ncbi:MAG TPA: acyclic terpene utilization AtuA family protein [Pirellulales bacterium]|nr:acyclic terpene utilization AtuA family protein [Pirellulales bacterium]
MTIKIANGAGFLGDNLDAPRLLVKNARVDYLTLEYLAELTMSILARQRQKDSTAGYATDFLQVLQSLLPALKTQPQLKIITNAGGVNPLACAAAAGKILAAAGLGETAIGIVTGDDLLPRLQELQAAGCRFENLETNQPLSKLPHPVVCANAYLGARPVAEALGGGARIVITGRVADASLTVGPAMYEMKRNWNDWNFLAGASVAGHLIECGAQVTGGLYCHWQNLDLANVGYPIAEIHTDGSCTITKPTGTDGAVNRHTVIEQLVYEIGDPAHYLTPDVDVDFTTIDVEEIEPNQVAVRGATGRSAPENYKVSLAYADGFTASGQLLAYGEDCVEKARACGQIILQRVERAGFKLQRTLIECLGAGDGVPGQKTGGRGQGAGDSEPQPREVVLRVSVRDSRREAVERFAKEIAPLITSGPPGLAGYATGRPQVRPVFAYWPTLVPKRFVQPTVFVQVAHQWRNAV